MTAIVNGAELLREVEILQAEIAAKESKCPADKEFQNVLTQIAQDALDAILEAFEQDSTRTPNAEILRAMIRLALGAGATGSGALDQVRASDLDARMEAQANRAFNDASEAYIAGNEAAFDEAVAVDVSREHAFPLGCGDELDQCHGRLQRLREQGGGKIAEQGG